MEAGISTKNRGGGSVRGARQRSGGLGSCCTRERGKGKRRKRVAWGRRRGQRKEGKIECHFSMKRLLELIQLRRNIR